MYLIPYRPLLIVITACFLINIFSTVNGFGQAPIISSVTPVRAPVGSAVKIQGSFFNSNASNNFVLVGGIKAKVSSASAGSLSIIVPAGGGYQPVSVLNTSTGLTGYSALPFTITADSKGNILPTDVDPGFDFKTGYLPSDMKIADVDGDGLLDAVVLNGSNSSNSISFFRNTAKRGIIQAASFANRFDLSTGYTPAVMAVQDIDGDGKPDLIVLSSDGTQLVIYHNNAVSGTINTSSFGAGVTFNMTAGTHWLTTGDFDSDGKPDILTSTGESLTILLNQSVKGSITAASFAAQPHIIQNFTVPVVVDLDSDGRPDIAGLNDLTNELLILNNAITQKGAVGPTSFKPAVTISSGKYFSYLTTGDINNDGRPDLIGLDKNNNTLSVLQNAVSGTSISQNSFLSVVNFTTGKFPFHAAVGDIDSDGLSDIIVSNYRFGGISIFQNKYTGGNISLSAFPDRTELPTKEFSRMAALGDFDGDGRPDIAVTNDIYTLTLFRNNPVIPPVITNVMPLSGPVGTSVTITGTNFNYKSAKNNVVFFGATKAEIQSASATKIVVKVPQGTTYRPISVLNAETQRTGFSNQPFKTTFPGKSTILAGDFENPGTGVVGSKKVLNVELYDMDGDGKSDMVTAETDGDNIYIAQNKGTFSEPLSGLFAHPVSCRGANNGSINISAAIPHTYIVQITGVHLNANYSFTESITIDHLEAGSYAVCIKVDGQAGTGQCYTLVITEPQDLAVYATAVSPDGKVTMTLNGGAVYYVSVNGKEINTTANQLTLTLSEGSNTIRVQTDKACQGIFEKALLFAGKPLVYPNPFRKTLNISSFDLKAAKTVVSLYNFSGVQVYTATLVNVNGQITLDLPALKPGTYVLKLRADQTEHTFKVIKQ